MKRLNDWRKEFEKVAKREPDAMVEVNEVVELLDQIGGEPFFRFLDALIVRFNGKLKDGGNRSEEPWKDFDREWLNSRLVDEYEEWRWLMDHPECKEEDKLGELVDIGVMSGIVWNQGMLGDK